MAEPAPDHIMQVAMGFFASKTLLSAVELGVFSTLADGPADLSAMRSKLGLHERSACDFLDALVALKFLERHDGLYRNTAETDLFLGRGKPGYIGGFLEMANARLYGFWGSLTEALRTGSPQNEAKSGENLFATIYADPDRLRGFLGAMSGISTAPASAIAARFPFDQYNSFVDVGSAQGVVPVTVARAHPHLRGTGFDLPAVRPVFEDFVAKHRLADRVGFAAGDFFQQALPSADVIIMGHILHDWDLPQRKLLLGKAFDALPKGGALIVYDLILDDDRRENAFGLLVSLNMLIETSGGAEYTGAEIQAWMTEAGFSSTRVENLGGPHSMAIGIK